MQPIPFEVGVLQFEVIRKKTGLNVMHPIFQLFLEKGRDELVSILFAKKRPFNKTANYLISQDKAKSKRSGEDVIGKVRGNEARDRYFLYNNGENPKNAGKALESDIRNEYLVVSYKYVPCSIGKLRKSRVVIPAIDYSTGKIREHKPL
jgi:hypothetical protein